MKKWLSKIQKSRTYILCVLFVIFIPAGLNYLMKKESLFDYVGNDTDWLSFWGSYLGGCFTVLLGIYSISQENKRQSKLIRHEAKMTTLHLEIENCKVHRQEIINYINNDLNLVDSSQLTIIIDSYIKHGKGKGDTIENLTNYLSKCTQRKNKCNLIKQEEPIFYKYNQQMVECLDVLVEETNKVIDIMSNFENLNQRKEHINKIMYLDKINTETEKLIAQASEIIKQITEKISSKEKELHDLQLKTDL